MLEMLDELFDEINQLKDYKHTLKDLISFHLLEVAKYEGENGNIYYYLTSKSSNQKYWISWHIGEYLIKNIKE